MRNQLTALLCVLAIALVCGCGRDKTKEPRPGAAGHAEELADSTRLDSARTPDSYDSASLGD